MSDKARYCAAVLTHVDAGKTTLSEALLYESGMIRQGGPRGQQGCVSPDTFALEKERGITIFSKQGGIKAAGGDGHLLDTLGHGISAEMERTLPVLDYAILVIGADGVQAHTRTLFGLWRV